jgi:ribosomal subunit interface protein
METMLTPVTMQIKIHSKQLALSDEQNELIKAKVSHLADLAERIKDESSEIRVDLSHEQSRAMEDAYECHLTLFVPHSTLRSESRAESLENVVDQVIEKMKPQVEKYKAKENHMNDRHSN